jgi:hypothetical protein
VVSALKAGVITETIRDLDGGVKALPGCTFRSDLPDEENVAMRSLDPN